MMMPARVNTTVLQQIEIVQLVSQLKVPTSRRDVTHLVIILHNGPLPRACVYPCHKVLHMSGDEHGGVGDGLRSNADVTLLYCPYCLLVSDGVTKYASLAELPTHI